MTTPADIDRTAPVIARHEIDINAPLDTVWNLHTDVDAWPAWNLEVTTAKLDGAFAPGNSFTWTSYDFTITSTIYAVAERARTLWGGAARGIMGTHEWVYNPDTRRRPRGHARVLERPAGPSRRHRDAISPGQVTDRLARAPQGRRRRPRSSRNTPVPR